MKGGKELNLWVELRLNAIVREVEKIANVSLSYTATAMEVVWHVTVKSKKTNELVTTRIPVDYKTATSPDMTSFLQQTVEEINELGWLEND